MAAETTKFYRPFLPDYCCNARFPPLPRFVMIHAGFLIMSALPGKHGSRAAII
jgi:hypothetical protein